MTEELALLAGQLLLKYGPKLAADFLTLFHKQGATLQDWLDMLNRVPTADQMLDAAKERAGVSVVGPFVGTLSPIPPPQTT